MPPKESAPDPFEVRRDRLLIRIRNLQHHPSVEGEDLELVDRMASVIQDARTTGELTEIEYVLSEVEENL